MFGAMALCIGGRQTTAQILSLLSTPLAVNFTKMVHQASHRDLQSELELRALAVAEWRRLEWANGLPEESIELFFNQAELVALRRGDVLADLKSELTHAYFVVTGRLSVELYDLFERPIERSSFGRGNIVGLLALMSSERPLMQISSIDNSIIFRCRLADLLALARADPAFQRMLFRQCANIVKRVTTNDRIIFRPAVIGFVHQSHVTRMLTDRIVGRLRSLGENVCVAGDNPKWIPDANVPYKALVSDGKLIDSSERESILREWSSPGRLILDVAIENSPSGLLEVVGNNADVILWCTDVTSADSALRDLRELVNLRGWVREKIRLVWLLHRGEEIASIAPGMHQLVEGDFKLSFEKPHAKQGQLLYRGTERLIQFLRGVQIGIALGGGAARGMAHLGVLKALEENGIYVDRIAGTSAGAMTGMTYAAGMDPTYATNCFRNDLRPSWIYRRLPGGGYLYLLHKYRYNQFDGMLRKYLHEYLIEQLCIPITTIAVDLVEGEPVIRTEGDATRNVLESINLPPLSLPIFDSGRALVDGGLLNNVPANVLASQGCNFVIASTVTASLEKDFMGIREKGKPIRRMFSNLQVMMRQTMIQNHKMNAVGVQPADFVIAPDVTAFDISEFSRADEIAEIGEATTLSRVAELRNLLAKLDYQLFGS